MAKNIYYPCKPAAGNDIKGWSIGEGFKNIRGVSGQVFRACRKNDCEFVMKIMNIDSHDTIKGEICFQEICAKHGLCQPVIDWWLCSSGIGGVIISPILKATLKDRRETLENGEEDWKLLKQALRLILKLHQLGITHKDTHLRNFMVDENDRVFLIDMGMSELIAPNKSGSGDYTKLAYFCCLDILDPYFDQINGIPRHIAEVCKKSSDKIIDIETEMVENILSKSYDDIVIEWKHSES